MLSRGDTLGHYRILARLRAGGMATLYLGQRTGAAGFTRPVAIKVIHPHLAENPRFVEMFVDEARLTAKLDDPHIVHIEELAEASGTYFLVMEYVDGVSLAQLLRDLGRRKRGPSIEIATWVAMQIAAGLHAAHEATDERGVPLKIVHRDVSPHNVLLAFKGHVKLIDFGVAKAAGLTKDTQTGSLRGKIAYMPPEQAYGKPVDRRADVYALGIVLWEMLTMRRLFEADNDLALLENVRKPNIMPPSKVVAGVPPALESVVMAALQPDPAHRPATAEAFRTMLAAAVPGALQTTARDVATMIAAILPEQIADSRKRLSEVLGASAPLEASLAIEAVDHTAQEALATMTIENPAATILFEDERASASPPALVQPVLHPPAAAPPPRRSSLATTVVPFVLAFVLAGAGVVGALAIAKARKPAAQPSAEATSATSAPSTSPAADPPVPPPSSVVVAPDPPASIASAPSSTPTPSASVALHPKSRTTPRTTKPASATAPTSSVEMHNGVPIFNKGL